jgi:hypothetical protein
MRITVPDGQHRLVYATTKLGSARLRLRNRFNSFEWPGYTERERLLIEFSEPYMPDCQGICADEEFWKRVQAQFSDTEIGELCMLAGHWECSRTTLHLLLGMDEMDAIPVGDVTPVERARELGVGHTADR